MNILLVMDMGCIVQGTLAQRSPNQLTTIITIADSSTPALHLKIQKLSVVQN